MKLIACFGACAFVSTLTLHDASIVQVFVLDGGLPVWKRDGFELETTEPCACSLLLGSMLLPWLSVTLCVSVHSFESTCGVWYLLFLLEFGLSSLRNSNANMTLHFRSASEGCRFETV